MTDAALAGVAVSRVRFEPFGFLLITLDCRNDAGVFSYNDDVPAPRQPSYAWALHANEGAVPISKLSMEAQAGFLLAAELALDSSDRRDRNLRGRQRLEPLTLAAIADREQMPEQKIRDLIARAHLELFDGLTASDYKKRLARHTQRAQRPARKCKQHGCPLELDPQTHGNRQYCEQHATAPHHTRRHRAKLKRRSA